MKANSTLDEVLDIMDNHHCIVIDELGKSCAKLRCDQLGIDTSEVVINPDQLRLEVL